MARLKYLISCSNCDLAMSAQKTLMSLTVIEHLQANPEHLVLVSAEVVRWKSAQPAKPPTSSCEEASA